MPATVLPQGAQIKQKHRGQFEGNIVWTLEILILFLYIWWNGNFYEVTEELWLPSAIHTNTIIKIDHDYGVLSGFSLKRKPQLLNP